jgi:hypothetical protein
MTGRADRSEAVGATPLASTIVVVDSVGGLCNKHWSTARNGSHHSRSVRPGKVCAPCTQRFASTGVSTVRVIRYRYNGPKVL